MSSSIDLISQLNFSIKNRSKFFICKKSKLNIGLLKLLLNNGFILNFYQFKFLRNKLCVFLKYCDKKPVIKKIIGIRQNIFLSFKFLKGDYETNIFFIISTNLGGLFLLNFNNYINLNWYNKFGGKVLFKIYI